MSNVKYLMDLRSVEIYFYCFFMLYGNRNRIYQETAILSLYQSVLVRIGRIILTTSYEYCKSIECLSSYHFVYNRLVTRKRTNFVI
jgi:hypothetical protein